MTTPLLLYGAWCILFAWINARWIKQDTRIAHAGNGAAHISTAAWFALHFQHWELFFMVLCIVRVVFTTFLNLFSKGDPFYVTRKPRALIDKAEQFFFGRSAGWPLLVYIVLFIVMLAIYQRFKIHF